MSVLPDHEIEGLCSGLGMRLDKATPLIDPFKRSQLQPASYDVCLGAKILIPTAHGERVIINNPLAEADARAIDLTEPMPEGLYKEQDISRGYMLFPMQFVLGSTVERVCVRDDMVGRIEGKSSIGRLGMTAHITAGYLDPGFEGNVTLEIANFFPRPIRLWPGVRIAQIGFEWMNSSCERPYGSPGLGSHYQGDEGVVGSRYGETE